MLDKIIKIKNGELLLAGTALKADWMVKPSPEPSLATTKSNTLLMGSGLSIVRKVMATPSKVFPAISVMAPSGTKKVYSVL